MTFSDQFSKLVLLILKINFLFYIIFPLKFFFILENTKQKQPENIYNSDNSEDIFMDNSESGINNNEDITENKYFQIIKNYFYYLVLYIVQLEH